MGSAYNDDVALNGGAAWLLFGSASLSQTIRLNGTGVDVTIQGKAASDRFGKRLAGAGDVNLDGFDDAIISAYLNNDGGSDDEGASYVLYGGSSISGTIPAGNLNVTLLGKAIDDFLGRGASGIGDLNGDGFDEVMAGADLNNDAGADAGAVYILYGTSSLRGTFATSSAEENISILGDAAGDEFGYSVSGLGDVNDDGFSDFIVGAILNDDGQANSGAAYVFYGSPTFPSQTTAGNADVTILGRNSSDQLGRDVMGIGDLNNDGFPDIAAGALYGDGVTTNAGAAYVIFGGESISSTINLAGAGADVTLAGKNASDDLGRFIGGGHMNRGP